jgi:hypothetical protein
MEISNESSYQIKGREATCSCNWLADNITLSLYNQFFGLFMATAPTETFKRCVMNLLITEKCAAETRYTDEEIADTYASAYQVYVETSRHGVEGIKALSDHAKSLKKIPGKIAMQLCCMIESIRRRYEIDLLLLKSQKSKMQSP